MKLTDDGNLKTYIGVEFERQNDGIMILTQKFLINRIINALKLPDIGSIPNPVIKPNLFEDKEGPDGRQKWHY